MFVVYVVVMEQSYASVDKTGICDGLELFSFLSCVEWEEIMAIMGQ